MEEKYYKDLGAFMRDIRVQNNMTMAEVGKRINKSENTISRYELGMTQLSLVGRI